MSKRSIGEREAFDDWVTSEVAIKLSDECEAFGGWKLRVSSVATKLPGERCALDGCSFERTMWLPN